MDVPIQAGTGRCRSLLPLVCPKCGFEMRIIAVITDGYEINKILKHLIKTGKSFPDVDESLLN